MNGKVKNKRFNSKVVLLIKNKKKNSNGTPKNKHLYQMNIADKQVPCPRTETYRDYINAGSLNPLDISSYKRETH